MEAKKTSLLWSLQDEITTFNTNQTDEPESLGEKILSLSSDYWRYPSDFHWWLRNSVDHLSFMARHRLEERGFTSKDILWFHFILESLLADHVVRLDVYRASGRGVMEAR